MAPAPADPATGAAGPLCVAVTCAAAGAPAGGGFTAGAFATGGFDAATTAGTFAIGGLAEATTAGGFGSAPAGSALDGIHALRLIRIHVPDFPRVCTPVRGLSSASTAPSAEAVARTRNGAFASTDAVKVSSLAASRDASTHPSTVTSASAPLAETTTTFVPGRIERTAAPPTALRPSAAADSTLCARAVAAAMAIPANATMEQATRIAGSRTCLPIAFTVEKYPHTLRRATMARAANQRSPVVLVVLDGWGYRQEREGNAVALANVPVWNRLWSRAPRTLLGASGLAVGLPEGQMGNSEVGHLNLGAGRVVMQDLVRIGASIRDGEFFRNPVLRAACAAARKSGGTLHLMGLIGDGGVHAHEAHLLALVELATREGVPRIAIHAELDGRDTMPTAALGCIEQLERQIAGRAVIASVGGRYYGMDRDNRWPRTELWYRAAVDGTGPSTPSAELYVREAYERGETDEFIKPAVVVSAGKPVAPMRDGDALVCWNYRSDRMRQIVRAIAPVGSAPFDGFPVGRRPVLFVADDDPVRRDLRAPRRIRALFDGEDRRRGIVRRRHDHPAYGGDGEVSPRDIFLQRWGRETIPGRGTDPRPEPESRDLRLDAGNERRGYHGCIVRAHRVALAQFTLVNYANGDMVGHSGNLAATIKACEVVDQCLARVVASAEKTGTRLLITADHGNCEMMIDPQTGGPHTAHTTNPVPFVIVGDHARLRDGGALCDVGPTVLSMLGVETPPDMTGTDLRMAEVGS